MRESVVRLRLLRGPSRRTARAGRFIAGAIARPRTSAGQQRATSAAETGPWLTARSVTGTALASCARWHSVAGVVGA